MAENLLMQPVLSPVTHNDALYVVSLGVDFQATAQSVVQGGLPTSGVSLHDLLTWTGVVWQNASASSLNLLVVGAVAGGDLSGTYPNPSVHKLAGQVLSLAGLPTMGDVLTWNGAAWDAEPGAGGGGPPTGPAGGDLTGTYPNPTVGSLAALPLSLIGVPTIGHVLTWNGAAWDAEGTGPGTQLVQAGGLFEVDSFGAILGLPAPGRAISLQDSAGFTHFSIDGSGNLALTGTLGQVINLGATGGMSLVSSSGQVNFPVGGPFSLTGPGSAIISFDNTNNIQIQPGGGAGLGFFFGGPVGQQTGAGIVAGFVPNASANPVFNESTWTGNTGATAYTFSDIVAALKNYGLLVA